MNLEDLSAIVTGGAQGIGEATSWNLARSGVRVAILDHSEKKRRKLLNPFARQASKLLLSGRTLQTSIRSIMQSKKSPKRLAEYTYWSITSDGRNITLSWTIPKNTGTR